MILFCLCFVSKKALRFVYALGFLAKDIVQASGKLSKQFMYDGYLPNLFINVLFYLSSV